ncbi:hypothetical protein OCO53_25350 [Peribacillus frigoritolerans]|uniref:hypothetical protein n=1 Tax=Peribacillus frigoritolerans TaxID=450367 RepID=UPI0021D2DE08|nr:hypothetical protein [Peribacillus frigoritolerans]MCU6603770.1 hypothetical protein [Peribacillus frigoritolerans]
MAKKQESPETKTKDIELTEGQKAAQEITTAQAKNEKLPQKKYKLADPNSSYQDHSFTLVADQEKELPENPTSDLIARIQSGFIVEA